MRLATVMNPGALTCAAIAGYTGATTSWCATGSGDVVRMQSEGIGFLRTTVRLMPIPGPPDARPDTRRP